VCVTRNGFTKQWCRALSMAFKYNYGTHSVNIVFEFSHEYLVGPIFGSKTRYCSSTECSTEKLLYHCGFQYEHHPSHSTRSWKVPCLALLEWHTMMNERFLVMSGSEVKQNRPWKRVR
jgi:hypothetical protein